MACKLLTVDDFEEYSRTRLPLPHREFYRNGAGLEITLRDNVSAFDRIILRPRFLIRDVTHRSLATRFLNQEVTSPIGVAPTAMQKLAHPDGEIASAKACEKSGCLFILSTMSTTRMEDVAAAAPNACKWFQLYLNKDHDLSARHMRRAEKCGFKAIVLTVDLPVLGLRFGEQRSGFTLPPHLKLANFDNEEDGSAGRQMNDVKQSGDAWKNVPDNFDDTMTWNIISWIRTVTTLPIIVKGLLTADDAMQAVIHGAHGIIVSNHGARQLDSCPSTIEALPEIVAAVNGRIPVFVDGGIRRGTDVLKALAIGANGVFVGRPVLWALTADGQKGVERVLQILSQELSQAMALSGCSKIGDIDRGLVKGTGKLSKL